MRKLLRVAAYLANVAVSASVAMGAVTGTKPLPDGQELSFDHGTLRLQAWADGVIRVTYAKGPGLPELNSLSVVGAPAKVELRREDAAQCFTFSTPRLTVRVDKQTDAVTFLNPSGATILAEAADGRAIDPTTQNGISGTSCAQTFLLPSDEGIYGLGQHQQGFWNHRASGSEGGGVNVRLAQANTQVGIPVITSSKGYVLLWDNPAVTNVSVGGPAGANAVRWNSEFGRAIDYYICYGDGTIDTAIRAYRQLTGDAPMMPKWLLGFWQSKERYATQKEAIEVATKYREMKVPIDGIIQDWQYWPPGNDTWGSHEFDPARFPDPEGMFRQLHAMNYHVLISVWAKFDLGSKNSKELNEAGGMFPEITRYVFPPGNGQWYDPFSTKGREIYWRQIREQLFTKGIDGWWLDAPEPEITNMRFRSYTTGAGPGYSVYNAYPLMHSKGIYEGQRALTGEKRVVILTRSAYAGQQRNSAITWSGDIQSTWDAFRKQIPAGLNFCLSGIPYWNTDTGGFFNNRATGDGNAKSPEYQQLFSRWFQYSAFCPMFRVHGAYGLKPGREIYLFDEGTQRIMRTYLDLRYRLLPYTYSTTWQITSNGATLMRPLVMDFPNDPQARDIGDQYFFGSAILVTPVTTADATTRSVYLPACGADWYDFWTGTPTPGGKRVEAAAPIEKIPLFIRPGSILPMGPLLHYANEKPADPLEIRVYPGANGSFTLYEDEGDSYRYEKGVYSTIAFTWNDATKTLSVGARQGNFPGMLKQRTFKIVVIKPNHGGGGAPTESPDRSVTYDGTVVDVGISG